MLTVERSANAEVPLIAPTERSAEALDQQIEHGRVDGLGESEAGDVALDPCNFALERFQALELDPHPLAHAGAVDELDLAAVRRGVEHADTVIGLARAAHGDVRGNRDPLALARPVPLRLGR